MRENTIKKLIEVCDFQGGSQPPKSEFIHKPKDGYVRFLQIRDFASDKNITYIPESKKNRYCLEQDILLGRYGASVGKVLTNKKGAYNVAVIKTIPNEELLSKPYLYYYLLSNDFQKKLLTVAARSAQAGFSKKDISDFPILIPPLPEQKSIVSKLNKAFAAIDKAKANAQQNLNNAKELFNNYLQKVFENNNGDWKEKKVIELCDSIVDCINKTAPSVIEKTGFKMVRTTNVRDGKLNLEKVRYVTEETYNKWIRRQVPEVGDILFTREAPMGEVGMLLSNDKVFLGQRIVSYRFNESIAHNHFMLYAFQSSLIKKQIEDLGSGATVKHLRVPHTKEFIFRIPSIKEQKQIVGTLNIISTQTQNLEKVYQQKLVHLEELKKSILQKAFSGEL